MSEATNTRGLLERLEDGPVICAEGYLFEFERRGYLQAGAFVPEIVLEDPGWSRASAASSSTRARTSSRRSRTTGTARSCG